MNAAQSLSLSTDQLADAMGSSMNAYNLQKELSDAACQFAASDGMNIWPLIDLYHRRNPDGAKLSFYRNGRDDAFVLDIEQPDGSIESMTMGLDGVRAFGILMTEELRSQASEFATSATCRKQGDSWMGEQMLRAEA